MSVISPFGSGSGEPGPVVPTRLTFGLGGVGWGAAEPNDKLCDAAELKGEFCDAAKRKGGFCGATEPKVEFCMVSKN